MYKVVKRTSLIHTTVNKAEGKLTACTGPCEPWWVIRCNIRPVTVSIRYTVNQDSSGVAVPIGPLPFGATVATKSRFLDIYLNITSSSAIAFA